jgi:hypothetical protein
MAELTCAECKATVSDESGYCPECGFPFEQAAPGQNSSAVSVEEVKPLLGTPDVPPEESSVPVTQEPPKPNVTTPMDIILRSVDSVALEVRELRSSVSEIRRELDSHLVPPPKDDSQKALSEITARLETIAQVQASISAALQPVEPSKKKLLATFYKTLNSPNSMFEYLFYICIVQLLFVIVNLFLGAYIVSLINNLE